MITIIFDNGTKRVRDIICTRLVYNLEEIFDNDKLINGLTLNMVGLGSRWE